MTKPTIWRVRTGAEKRFKSGHPWLYSNELISSPKGLEPGAPVELHDAAGKFLARGYGNPASLISFRAVTRDVADAEALSPSWIATKLLSCWRMREALGLGSVSFRLCFGEGDFLPGLVIDRYVTEDKAQIFAVQLHTAGMQRAFGDAILSILEQLTIEVSKTGAPNWARTAVVLRNDLSVRKLEGLTEEEPRTLKEVAGLELARAKILLLAPHLADQNLTMTCDLSGGQKTGFFMDQAWNIQLGARLFFHPPAKTIRILDLCSYVGQWGVQLGTAIQASGRAVEVTAVDASAGALSFAAENLSRYKLAHKTIKGDVLRDLEQFSDRSFDLIISDPPALIKGRKDIPVGKHAYLQLNTQVFRIVKDEGAVVTCSCSGLLEEAEFERAVSKAAYRNGRRARWVGRGAQGPDHPALLEFPEGRYLKALFGFVSKS